MGIIPDYYSNYPYYQNYYDSLRNDLRPSEPTESPVVLRNQSILQTPEILSEYFATGLTEAFVAKYQRELTVAASSLSVIIVIVIGSCIWCLVGLVKRGIDDRRTRSDQSIGEISASSGYAGPSSLSSGRKTATRSDDIDSSCSNKSLPIKSISSGIPIISRIFTKRSGNSVRLLAQHRNIVTPDRNIPFIVPTIQLPAQPPEQGTSDPSHYLSTSPSTSPLEPQTSTSARGKNSLLLAQQFFPQLEHPQSDSCPLVAFSLYYELSSQILNVRLLEGRNFPDTLVHSVSVKVYPGRGSKQHTKEFKCRSPVYNQEFCFHVRKASLHTKILKLRAVIPGVQKRVIGYVNVALKDLPGFDKIEQMAVEHELARDTQDENAYDDLKTSQLWRRVELPSEIGDGVKLQVSLKWSPEPTPGLLTLKIIEAGGLHENRGNDYTSSYVKVTLQEQGRSIKTRKTQLVRWGSVPVFDDVFVLTIPRELLTQISFLLVVIARGRLGSKAVLGKICVGPVPYAVASSSSGTALASTSASCTSTTAKITSSTSCSGIEFWEDMCHQPDMELVRWLHLVP